MHGCETLSSGLCKTQVVNSHETNIRLGTSVPVVCPVVHSKLDLVIADEQLSELVHLGLASALGNPLDEICVGIRARGEVVSEPLEQAAQGDLSILQVDDTVLFQESFRGLLQHLLRPVGIQSDEWRA